MEASLTIIDATDFMAAVYNFVALVCCRFTIPIRHRFVATLKQGLALFCLSSVQQGKDIYLTGWAFLQVTLVRLTILTPYFGSL